MVHSILKGILIPWIWKFLIQVNYKCINIQALGLPEPEPHWSQKVRESGGLSLFGSAYDLEYFSDDDVEEPQSNFSSNGGKINCHWFYYVCFFSTQMPQLEQSNIRERSSII